jgi:murein DD-endopeptidase MepM/ murein hydrolase activator NlpD
VAFDRIVRGGGVLTQDFGQTAYAMSCHCEWTCPGYAPGAFHAGIDIASARGSVLTAAGYGVVTRIGRGCPGCGCDGLGPYAVCVNSGPVDIWYGHAYQALVSIGQQVQDGSELALMDSVGCSTGNHVHFEVLPHGQDPNGCGAINPWQYVNVWPGQAPQPDPGPPPDQGGLPVSSSLASALLVAGAGLFLLSRRGA